MAVNASKKRTHDKGKLCREEDKWKLRTDKKNKQSYEWSEGEALDPFETTGKSVERNKNAVEEQFVY